jgi:uncharacterized protein (DUF2237 family)
MKLTAKRRRQNRRTRRIRLKGGAITKNVLGGPLRSCSNATQKTTGFYRDSFCNTGPTDHGTHVVCATMTDEFLQFSRSKGNDLITPHPPSFPGLVAGDRWCLCAHRWYEAYKANKAPPVHLESTHQSVRSIVPLEDLLSHKAILHKI